MVVKCAYISFCACFGTLARLYTDDGLASNLALQGSFLANSAGSFALGLLANSPVRESTPQAVYTGLTVVSTPPPPQPLRLGKKIKPTSSFPLGAGALAETASLSPRDP